MIRRGKRVLVIAAITMGTASAVWAGDPGEGIGLFTAVRGHVSVTHPGSTRLLPVNVRDDVFFKDVIETREKSRTKAFFDDETILTVGENSRVTVTEHIYNPELGVRRVVINLVLGKLRALVGQAFTGTGSKFEIHTPTAVAAARGTYFVVWVDPSGASGIANIGEAGNVDFTSGGRTVTVAPGEYSMAPAGEAPEMPLLYQTDPGTAGQVVAGITDAASLPVGTDLTGQLSTTIGDTLSLATETLGILLHTADALAGSVLATPTEVFDAITGTELLDAPPLETPRQIVQALGLLPASTFPSTDLLGTPLGPDADTQLFSEPTALSGSLSAGAVGSVVGGTVGSLGGAVGSVVGGTVGSLGGTVGSVVGGTVGTVGATVPAVTSGVTGLTEDLGLLP